MGCYSRLITVGFGVSGLGPGLGFRAWGLGFRVWGLGFNVKSRVYRVLAASVCIGLELGGIDSGFVIRPKL